MKTVVPTIDASDGEMPGEREEAQAKESSNTEEVEASEDDVLCEECGGENKTKGVKDPGMPTPKERAEHEWNHWPFRQWCEPCVKGRAIGQQHRSLIGEAAESSITRVLMDYGFLHEEETVTESEHGKETQSTTSMTIMVMLETLCKSIWAYAIEGKGAISVDWLAQQVVEDIETVGLAEERIITKTDQEASIIQLQQEVARRRKDTGTALENSRVGDSDSNGRIERAMREVKGLIRTLRCWVEMKTGCPVRLDSAIVPWIVRHAGYVITRCQVQTDGKTAMQKMKGRRVNVPWIPFAESVLFKLPKVPNMPGDFRDRFENGVWVGCTIRSGEHLVATEKGVFKVSSVVRKPEDRRWSSEAIKSIKGSPKEPVPGSGSSRLIAYSKHRSDHEVRQPGYLPARSENEEPEVRANYIFKRDVEKHGATAGCPGCRALANPNSKFRAKHSPECRRRMEEALKQTEEGAKRVQRADERITNALVKKSEEIMEDDRKKRKTEGGSDEQAQEAASGSGITDEERRKQLERMKEQERENSPMEEDEQGGEPFGPHGAAVPRTPDRRIAQDIAVPTSPEDDIGDDANMAASPPRLEEAPAATGDIRVPMEPRTPAQKRGHEPGKSPAQSKWQAFEKTEDGETDNLEVRPTQKGTNPGPVINREEMTTGDLMWKDIGSGTVARTFKDAKELRVSTQGGPPECDVFRRTVWDLSSGKLIDDCIVDDTPDELLFRSLPHEMDIRVELVLKDALALYARKGADVVEVFSQPRIVQEAGLRRFGTTQLTPGWSLDLTRLDPKTGRAWDLADHKVQSRVKKMVKDGKPMFVIGSPPCTAMSTMQNINKGRRDPKVVEKEIEEARGHVRFCRELYLMQAESGRFFVHEHPAGASSWTMKEMVELATKKGVDIVTFDMCCFGMTARKGEKEGPVRKRTKIISNSREVLKRVERKCPNDGGLGEKHEHVVLEDGRTKGAQVYPREFCRTVCEGVAVEKRLKALGLEAAPVMSLEEMRLAAAGTEAGGRYGEDPSQALHEDETEWMIAVDDQSGEPLEPKLVRAAREEEIRYFKERRVYEKVKVSECWEKTGKAPIGVKWVDINKGDSTNPNYRSRLVAMEFKTEERPEWYAATPPSECLKILMSKMAGDGRKKMMYADVSRAYFYALAARPVYVKLPEEDRNEGDEEMCGRLRVSMYGTRDAALNWAAEYGETLKEAGYKQGVSNPCLFWHQDKDVTIMVHGDDFVAIGNEENLKETKETLNRKYKIKVETLGAGKEDAKEIRVLNKVIRLTQEGLELEADPRHAEIVIRDLGLEEAKPSPTPGVKQGTQRRNGRKEDVEEGEEEPEEAGVSVVDEWQDREGGDSVMTPADARKYRAIVARLNYIASDRVDLQFAVKEAARNMSCPKAEDWHALKRIGKYLKGRPRLVMKFGWQAQIVTAVTYTDSDWAGCAKTAKSTSGGLVTLGKHLIKSYSRQQRTVALSSAEAELHAMVAASAETLGIIALCKDMGIEVGGEVYADSSAALGIVQRSGNGKVRHLRVQALWVQEVRCSKRLWYKKVLGTRNPADVLTKHVPKELLDAHLITLGVELRGGRAESAPTLDQLEMYTEEWAEGEDAEGEKEEEEKSKKVRFYNKVMFRAIPATGKCRKTELARKTRTTRTSWPGGASESLTVDLSLTGGRGTSPRASGGVHALVEAAGLPVGCRGGGHTRPAK